MTSLVKKTFSLFTCALLGLSLIGSTVHAAPYTVKQGDTLWKIATANSITVQQLTNLNPSVASMLYPGQVIQIPDDPNTYYVQPNDTFWKISVKFGITTSSLIQANPHIANPNILNVGDKLHIPVRPANYRNGTFPLKPGTYQPYTNNYAEVRTWSPSGEEIRAHEGVDIFAAKGTPVYSVLDGTIVNYGWNQYGGWRLTVKVDDSTTFYYAHLSGYAQGMKMGGTVKKGQLIGYVGNTGYGPEGTEGMFDTHLHFGIYKTNVSPWKTVDPYAYLNWWELQQ
ncbi:M23 family metallopeptidase [Paenibacillus hemerocallicola]|uniref:M23 family metallopeptidase n=1 Tax=Paenibacillus hemerocallicola TaxID=1172614 RepID=A0A5C4TD27_9BACL|nr:M23 family metallopeptidase [Paenibacillus hemerocallicola]